MTPVHFIDFENYSASVPAAMDAVGAPDMFKGGRPILLKPNLVNASEFPVTTHVLFCRAVIEYIRQKTDTRIIIAEGCGDSDLDTDEVFRILGYRDLADEVQVDLIDLNYAPVTEIECPANEIFPVMHLPEIAFESMIISLPVLKAHSLAEMTGTLKNMMGFAPPQYYSGGGFWKKAVFHQRMQQSIIELNRCLVPDLTLMDASLGLKDFHLGGATCNPPVNKLIAGTDPWAVDQAAARLLGQDPENIRHIHKQ